MAAFPAKRLSGTEARCQYCGFTVRINKYKHVVSDHYSDKYTQKTCAGSGLVVA